MPLIPSLSFRSVALLWTGWMLFVLAAYGAFVWYATAAVQSGAPHWRLLGVWVQSPHFVYHLLLPPLAATLAWLIFDRVRTSRRAT